MAEGDVKPKLEGAATINIRVKDQAGAETMFKVKPTTKLGKVMEAFASRKGTDVSTLRFIFDGQRISADDTPESLEMSDNDQIDAMLEQQGGSRYM